MALKIKTKPRMNQGFEDAKKEVGKKEQHRMNFIIEKEKLNNLKMKAIKNYTTPSALMRQWIDDYLKTEEE